MMLFKLNFWAGKGFTKYNSAKVTLIGNRLWNNGSDKEREVNKQKLCQRPIFEKQIFNFKRNEGFKSG